MHQYKELEFWKRSKQLSVTVYSVTTNFPKSEIFGITSQIRRSSISIPSNIAEGSSRRSNKDFSRFLEIALGSAYELDTQLTIANEIGFLDKNNHESMNSELTSIIQMMSKFKSRLQ